MVSRIGYNIHALGQLDRTHLLKHLRDLQPRMLLVLDDLSFAREIKGVLPACSVIYRDRSLHPQGDEAYAQVFTPQQFVDKTARFADGGLILHTTNEPGFSEQTVVWNTQVMELLAKRNIPAVVDGWAAGQPQDINAWKLPFMRRHLEILNDRSDLFMLNLHEYAGGVITSGFVGGHPQEIQYHPDYTKVENWPNPIQAKSVTMWHCGRFRFMQSALDMWKLKWPRIVITEHGFDMMRDIGGWLAGLKKSAGAAEIHGWATLTQQWEDWWRKTPGWGAEQAYFEQVAYADRAIYQGTAVEAQLLYCFGSNSPRWTNYNIQNAFNLQERLVHYAGTPSVPVTPPAPVVTTTTSTSVTTSTSTLPTGGTLTATQSTEILSISEQLVQLSARLKALIT